ncbi:MAG: tetratricopeptide repeat protein [Pseudomonadales bacterium]|nr:tetratricopeptide repeat protein [Pseudomonadales bacterium]
MKSFNPLHPIFNIHRYGCKPVTIFLVVATLFLAGCSGQATRPDTTVAINETVAPAVIPASLRSRYQHALTLLQQNKTKRAFVEFGSLTQDYPSYSGPYVNLALIHVQRNQPDQAIGLLKQAISANPISFSGHHQLAILYRKKGRFEDAERHYIAAKRVDSNHPEVHKDLAILYDLYMGKLTQALVLYQHYQTLLTQPNPALKGWIIDIKNRIKAQEALTQR